MPPQPHETSPLSPRHDVCRAALAMWFCLGGCLISGCGRSDVSLPTASISKIQHLPTAEEVQGNSSPLKVQPVSKRDPWTPDVPLRNWQRVVVHHTATTTGSVESIHASHLKKRDSRGNPWLGIGYHFVVGNGQGMADGEIEPTFRWRQQLPGAHAGIADINETGIGIALVGNFDKAPPSDAQMESVSRLVGELCSMFELTSDQIIGHGDIKATACPGRHFSLGELRSSVAALDDSGGPPLARFVPATGIPRKEALRK